MAITPSPPVPPAPADQAAAHGLRAAPEDDRPRKAPKPFKPDAKKAKYAKPGAAKGDGPHKGWAVKKPKGGKGKPKAS